MGWVAVFGSWLVIHYRSVPRLMGLSATHFYYAFLNISPQTMYTGNDGGLQYWFILDIK